MSKLTMYGAARAAYIACMRLQMLTGAVASTVLTLGIMLGPSAAANAATSVTCFGSVACAGGSAADCATDAVLIQDQQIPNLGDIDLYESDLCGTAWAVLTISGEVEINPGIWPELAEIFYEPPQGGPEQFNVTVWDGNPVDATTTRMVPVSGSVKACGGDPQGTTDPFDEDPQGTNGLYQDPSLDPEISYLSSGACTLWH